MNIPWHMRQGVLSGAVCLQSAPQLGAHCIDSSTVQDDAELSHANFTQAGYSLCSNLIYRSMWTTRAASLVLLLLQHNA